MHGVSARVISTEPVMIRFILYSAIALFANSKALSEFRPAPIEQKDLVGAWAGCTQGCTEFYRLDLKADGSGSLVILEPDLEHSLYSISGWKLQSEQLRMALKPHAGAETIEVKSLRLGIRYIEIQIQAPVVGWKRTVTLYNEKDWDERTRKSREATARLQSL